LHIINNAHISICSATIGSLANIKQTTGGHVFIK